jgi:hypothetical protein
MPPHGKRSEFGPQTTFTEQLEKYAPRPSWLVAGREWQWRRGSGIPYDARNFCSRWTRIGRCYHINILCVCYPIILGFKPLKRIVLLEDRPIHPIAILLHDLLSMNAVKLVFPLVHAATIRAVLRGAKYADMDVRIARCGESDLAEEVQAVCGDSNAHRFEVFGGEGGKVLVGEVFDCAEVFDLVFCVR